MAISIPVQLQNKAGSPAGTQARSVVVVHGVKFAKGEVGGTSASASGLLALSVSGASAVPTRVQWLEKGRLWSDGSAKYGKVAYLATFDGIEVDGDKECTISDTVVADSTPFSLHSSVSTAFAGGAYLQVQVNGLLADFYLDPWVGGFTLIEGGGPGDVYAEYERFARMNVPPLPFGHIWIRLRMRLVHNLPYAQFWFSWGNAYVGTGHTGIYENAWAFRLTNNPTLLLWGGSGFGAFIRDENLKCVATNRSADQVSWTLVNSGFGDHDKMPFGTSHGYRGVMTFDGSDTALAAQHSDVWGMAEDWPEKGVPPYGVVPAYPSYIANRDDGIARLKSLTNHYEDPGVSNHPYFASRLLNYPFMPATANQNRAFGVMRGWPMYRTGHPHMLDLLLRDAYQWCCRGFWFVEPDGSRWNTDNHPNAQWSWGDGAGLLTGSSDCLGQSIGHGQRADDYPRSTNASGPYCGPNGEHWEQHWHTAATLSTWDPLLESMQLYLVECYLALFTHYANYQSQRARGRGSMRSGAYLLELTGDARMSARMTDLLQFYISEENQPQGAHLVGSQFPNATSFGFWAGPDTDFGSGSRLAYHNWTDVWQLGIYSGGLLAAYNALSEGNASDPGALIARRLAYQTAVTATMQYFDNRDGAENRSIIIRRDSINGPQGRFSLDGADGRTNARDRILRTSSASGTVMYPGYNADFGDATEIYLHSVTGDFQNNEQFTIDGTTVTGTVAHVRRNWQASQSMRVFVFEPPPNDLRELTITEQREDALFTNLNNDTYWIARNVKWYYGYTDWQFAGAQVAKLAAEADYYGPPNYSNDRNAEILARATEIQESLVSEDPGASIGWDDSTEYAAVVESDPGGDGEIHNVGGVAVSVTGGTSRVDASLQSVDDSSLPTVAVSFGVTAFGTSIAAVGDVAVPVVFGQARLATTHASQNSGRLARLVATL